MLLDPSSKDVIDAPPGGNYHIHKADHRDKLVQKLPAIMKVTRGGKKSKKGAMGFVALMGDGQGTLLV